MGGLRLAMPMGLAGSAPGPPGWPSKRRRALERRRVPADRPIPGRIPVAAGPSAVAVTGRGTLGPVRTCTHCATRLSPLARADARYCSTRCRVAAHRRAHRFVVPDELVDRDRWIRYSSKKVPLQASGPPASSTDPRTWSTFAAASSSSVGVGLGFVLNGDGIVCIDLDHCLDGDRLAPWAAELLAVLPPTYVEVSPSGDGLHVWGTGSLERGRRLEFRGGAVEVYATGRYLTVTGRPFAGSVRTLAPLEAAFSLLI